ncbi:MAG: AMP-binding protein [Bacteroidaceae bacterium]|nr:AMP-binding protein [Bacteroidaceae bacterium]
MSLDDFISDWRNANPFLHVHTSGSTGKPKDLLVEKSRMEASARMTCRFLGLHEGDTALLCMPLDYIAGKMMVVRAQVQGLRLISVEPSSTPLDGVDEPIDFAAMVPMQVVRSLGNPKLRQIRHLIIGGGAIDEGLEAELRTFPNHVWSTYGMTETLSHIALRPINGPEATLWYTPMDGVSISLNADGCLVIDAPQVCSERLTTNDIAELNPQGQFRIVGRRDNTINTGGIKVQIEEVERLIASPLIMITSAPDPVLGETVVTLMDEKASEADAERIHEAIARLPKYWQPRRTIKVGTLPLTATGKPDRATAKKMAQ